MMFMKRKLFVIFVLIFACVLNAQDTTDNSNAEEEIVYEVIEMEDNTLPNLNISTSFRYSLNGKEFKEMAGKFKIDSSLYYMVSIIAIIPKEYDNDYINANIIIPEDSSNYKVKFYQGTLLNNSNTNFNVSVRTSYQSAAYQNNFIFKIDASKPCSISVKVQFDEPYSQNNSLSTIEFREKKFGIF
ncbi:hypothetical protein [Brachyspira pulli]|uniref:hypothetical protein n=1 Tax=Brachyspira pulli TaxID=310721 RepID=UPI003007E1A4